MNRDFRELLSEFSRHGVEYLVIGAHALAAHGHVRATKDLDVFVRADADNAERILAALRAFGAPLTQVTAADFAKPGITFQLGVAPVRIDICTEIDGVRFDDAWPRRETHRVEGLEVPVIGVGDLI